MTSETALPNPLEDFIQEEIAWFHEHGTTPEELTEMRTRVAHELDYREHLADLVFDGAAARSLPTWHAKLQAIDRLLTPTPQVE